LLNSYGAVDQARLAVDYLDSLLGGRHEFLQDGLDNCYQRCASNMITGAPVVSITSDSIAADELAAAGFLR